MTINNLIPPSLPRLNTYQLRPQLPDTHLNCHFNSNPYTTASHAPFESSYTTASTFTSQPAASYFRSNSTPATRKNSATTNLPSEERRRVSVSLSEQVFNEGERYNNDGQLIGKTGKPLRILRELPKIEAHKRRLGSVVRNTSKISKKNQNYSMA